MKLKITVVSIAVGVGIAAGAITVAVWHLRPTNPVVQTLREAS